MSRYLDILRAYDERKAMIDTNAPQKKRRHALALSPRPTRIGFKTGQVLLANGALFEIVGVHLQAIGQTDVIELKPLSEGHFLRDACMRVPAHILETALQGEAIFLESLLYEAVQRFGHIGGDYDIFTTASFQSLFEEEVTSQQAETILGKCTRVVRLYGGCYWMILPGEHRRFDGDRER